MNKPTLKVAYVDFWPEFNYENIFSPILEKYFEIQIDTNNPDLVIHSIFQGINAQTPKYKCKKILYCGENKRPDFYKSNYSISFDPHSNTNFQLPLWQYYILLNPEYKIKLFNRINNESFNRFCSFTVSNPNNFIRNGIFHQLSQYKHVHSYGRYLTSDTGLQTYSKGQYWRDAKDKFFSQYTHKFSIAYENSSYPYYTTEKLMDAFLGGSMPIYWGDPKVKENFNTKAFINVFEHGSNVIEYIKKLDNNDNLFNEKYHEPVFTEDQKQKHLENIEKFENWLINSIKK